MNRAWIAFLLIGLAACASARNPVARHQANPLLDDQRVTAPVQVTPVAAFPGLAEAVAKNLVDEEIPASTRSSGPRTIQIRGGIENGNLVWRLDTMRDRELGVVAQAIPPGTDIAALARDATPILVGLLTAGGSAEAAGHPHAALAPMKVPKDLDARLLSQGMADALVAQGVVVGPAGGAAVAVIEGELRLLPAPGGQKLAQVDWTVRDDKGRSLGTVSQSHAVDPGLFAQEFTRLARDIVDSAAPGVVQVLRAKAPAALAQ